MFYLKQMLIIKGDMVKLSNKMKSLVLHLKYMLKKEPVELVMQVEKLQFSLVVVLLMVQKGS